MPELPEVTITSKILDKKITGLKILDVWTDYDSAYFSGKNDIKNKKYFPIFKKEVIGKKIISVTRRAKNVLINLSGDPSEISCKNFPKTSGKFLRDDLLKRKSFHGVNKTILVHMKMTGHLLYGKYELKNGKYFPPKAGPLADPYNRFIHLVFTLSDGKHLAFSDTRKFGKVYVFDTDKINENPDLNKLGPEPLEKSFTYEQFKERLMIRSNWKIKQALMDQELIAGVGNIYSDEALWMSEIHPLAIVKKIPEKKMKVLYKNLIDVLKTGIKLGGDSMSDYRNPNGEPGKFHRIQQVYGRAGEKCQMKGCNGIIKRIKVAGRSANFCDCHQK